MSGAEMGAALMNLFAGIIAEVNEASEITVTIEPYMAKTVPANLGACLDLRPLDRVAVEGQRIIIDIQYKGIRDLQRREGGELGTSKKGQSQL